MQNIKPEKNETIFFFARIYKGVVEIMMRGLVGFFFVPLLSVIDSKITKGSVRRGSEWPGSVVQVHSLLIDILKNIFLAIKNNFCNPCLLYLIRSCKFKISTPRHFVHFLPSNLHFNLQTKPI